ncbi:hippurate hydrolase [Arenicella chitinivorans]|uniref:Hippurate hydrolase n=1 Tax=Arenicella chitinivorans TaxID=1329800 RepID=A0A918S230_9GAMM|nr:M20 family metallopeptidase [Arenicella chitinivorans]GHA20950.1 hippurate hydrolase [Arenicella chitinivorans]
MHSDTFDSHAMAIYPELLEVRHDLFDNPESSGKEERTARVVANYLKKLGLEVKTNIGGHGVVGVLKGAKPGKTVMWRADMDAATFRMGAHGHQGLSHICGHDFNTTIALGIANTLSQDVDNLAGTVVFLFQPAEESQQGAKAMIADGLFEMLAVDEVYASHIGPSATGVISTKTGNLFSHSRYLEIELNGTDAAESIASDVHKIMNGLTRVSSPKLFFDLNNAMSLTHGLANPNTIYQDYVFFAGPPQVSTNNSRTVLFAELYTANKGDIDATVSGLKKQLDRREYRDRVHAVRVSHVRQGVDNDARLVDQAKQLLLARFGDQVLETYYGQVPFASEDFGHFQTRVPGVYFFIGASNAGKGIVSFPHMPNFNVDEKVIRLGVTRFSTLLYSRLKTD